MCQAQWTQDGDRKQGFSYEFSGSHGPQQTKGGHPRYQTPFSREIKGLDPPEKFTTEVHPIRQKVRLEVQREPRLADDGPLEPYRCFNVPGVPIKLGGSCTEVVRQAACKVLAVVVNPKLENQTQKIAD